MPTHDETGPFLRDYENLTPQQQDRFDSKREEFVADLMAMERGRRQRVPSRVAHYPAAEHVEHHRAVDLALSGGVLGVGRRRNSEKARSTTSTLS